VPAAVEHLWQELANVSISHAIQSLASCFLGKKDGRRENMISLSKDELNVDKQDVDLYKPALHTADIISQTLDRQVGQVI
jgi:hypothetical protein